MLKLFIDLFFRREHQDVDDDDDEDEEEDDYRINVGAEKGLTGLTADEDEEDNKQNQQVSRPLQLATWVLYTLLLPTYKLKQIYHFSLIFFGLDEWVVWLCY